MFLAAYKLTAYYLFSGKGVLADTYTTHYGGIRTGGLSEFIQTGKETCGQAAAAFFLTKAGIPATESALIQHLGTDSMISLADIEQVFLDNGFKTQTLNVAPQYFKRRPATALLHFKEGHFAVFIRSENGTPMLFDPAYGQVYVSWNILTALFSGYMLYVYTD